MWIGPQFVVLFFAKHARNDPEILRDILPLGLLGLMLTSMLTATRVEGIHFTAAEVDFLFSGPFTRRHLLLYKLSSGMASSLFVALILSITLLRYASLWTAAFMGSFLTMVFVHLLITALVLAGQTMAQQMYTHARKAVLLVIIGLAVVVAANWLPIFFERGFQEAAHRLRCSSLGFWLFMPLEPFVRTIIAVKIPDLIGWAAAAAAIDLALLALVVRIDVNYMESSLVASQKRYLMLQRRRTGRLIVKPHVGWRVPQLPWLSGAGPIAWRQLTTALRSVHGLLPLFLIIVGIAVAPLLLQAQRASMGVGLFVGQICFLTMLMTRMVAYDFRGDLDCMDWTKSLPLRPIAITLGQLATPVLLMTAIHVMLLAAVVPFAHGSRMAILAAALFSPAFNFLLFGVDNLVFLLFPIRIVPTTPGDLQHIGRTMVEMTVKMLVLACGCGAAAAVGMAGHWITGGSWVVTLVLSWLALLLCACLIVPCIVWAYNRFDVSTDTPA
jgi:hypothetical protein